MWPGGVLARRLPDVIENPRLVLRLTATCTYFAQGLSQDTDARFRMDSCRARTWSVISSRLCCLCPCISLFSWITNRTYALQYSLWDTDLGVLAIDQSPLGGRLLIRDTMLEVCVRDVLKSMAPATKVQQRRTATPETYDYEQRQSHHFLMPNNCNDTDESAKGSTLRHRIFPTGHNCHDHQRLTDGHT